MERVIPQQAPKAAARCNSEKIDNWDCEDGGDGGEGSQFQFGTATGAQHSHLLSRSTSLPLSQKTSQVKIETCPLNREVTTTRTVYSPGAHQPSPVVKA